MLYMPAPRFGLICILLAPVCMIKSSLRQPSYRPAPLALQTCATREREAGRVRDDAAWWRGGREWGWMDDRRRRKSRDLPVSRGRELGLSGHEDAGAPDAVPPLAPTMSLTSSRTPHPSQLDGRPFAAPSPQSSPFALSREPVVPATRSILRLLSSRQPQLPAPCGGGDARSGRA